MIFTKSYKNWTLAFLGLSKMRDIDKVQYHDKVDDPSK